MLVDWYNNWEWDLFLGWYFLWYSRFIVDMYIVLMIIKLGDVKLEFLDFRFFRIVIGGIVLIF